MKYLDWELFMSTFFFLNIVLSAKNTLIKEIYLINLI